MRRLHRLQQRLSITRNEALTLISLSVFFMIGITGRHVCRRAPAFESGAYAEIDSIFAAQSSINLEEEHEDRAPSSAGARAPAKAADSSYAAADVNDSHDDVNPSADASGSPPVDTSTSSPADASASPSTNPYTDPSDASRPKSITGLLQVDINTADAADLQRLPRIGPKMAQRIIAFREAFGPLRSVDELLSVRGIGAKTLDLIRPHVRVTVDDTTRTLRNSHSLERSSAFRPLDPCRSRWRRRAIS